MNRTKYRSIKLFNINGDTYSFVAIVLRNEEGALYDYLVPTLGM